MLWVIVVIAIVIIACMSESSAASPAEPKREIGQLDSAPTSEARLRESPPIELPTLAADSAHVARPVRASQTSSVRTSHSALIRRAISQEKRIQFQYRKPSDSRYTRRNIKPYDLISYPHQRTSGSTLCVEGYCELRKEDRVFALKRMRNLTIMDS